MTLKSGEDQIKFTHDRHPTHFPIKKDRELDQNPSYVFPMGYDRGGGHELTLSDLHHTRKTRFEFYYIFSHPRK